MKTFFKILGIIILIILLALIVVPIAFKGQLLDRVKSEINKTVEAKVEFDDFQLSLIKRFPNLYVGLHELSVTGKDEFEGDTLVSFDAFEVVVDVVSAIKGDSIGVKAISLINPVMQAKVLEDGRANWDIMKETEEVEEEEEDTTASEPIDLSVKLKKFEIVNANITYDDAGSNMLASINGFTFTLTGDLSQKFSSLRLESQIKAINFIMNGIRYARDATFNLLVDVDADLENAVYTIKENLISLNNLTLGLEGVVSMSSEDNISVDVKYFTKETDFKTLLSLVPAVYLNDFQEVQTKGNLKLDGYARGIYNENIMPNVGLNLMVKNAMFNYPDLPESVDNINIDVKVLYDGVENDSTTVDINTFHLDIAGNPVDMVMNIKTPMSDMHINGHLTSDLDLASLADAVPMDDMSVTGKINTNVDIMGHMSAIEEERYEDFKADGQIKLTSLQYQSQELDYDVLIKEAQMDFSPRYVELASFDSKIGESDIQLYGKIENFIPYVFEDKTIKGELRFTSGYLNMNELMPEAEETAEVEEPVDKVAMSVVEVPKNIDFTLNSNLGKVIFDKMEIEDITGNIIIRDGIVRLDELSMNMLDGYMLATGEYNTTDIKNPFVDLNLDITGFDIPSAFNTFNTIEKLAPVAKNAEGKISSSLTFTSFLNHEMMPEMNSIISKGNLQSQSIQLNNANMFGAIGEKLGTERFNTFSLKDIDLSFEIREGKVYVDPFETKIGKGSAIIAGEQGLDQSLNYTINLTMPRSELGGAANTAIQNLTSTAMTKGIHIDPGENLNMDIKVEGTVQDPKVKLDLKDNAKRATEAVKEQVKEQVKAEIDKKKEEAKAKANAEAQRIIQNAEKKAQQVRNQAQKAAEIARKEAYDKAQRIEDEAKGKPKFARDLAKKAADKVRNEGDEKADKIIKEADKKANDIIERAKKEADRLTQ